MNKAYLSLGSNEGAREDELSKAIDMLSATGIITKRSSIYKTAAWGLTDQPDFLNMVLLLETVLAPEELLAAILKIELSMGRQRNIKWGPRTIDIDILFYNYVITHTPSLTIPHPLLQERRFILTPLAQIAPDLEHPILLKTISGLLFDCVDTSEVHIYN